jgi:hypothetical protein
MFYRPGGNVKAINRQYDNVYADFNGATTGWLPVVAGNWVGVNICRASIAYNNAAQSVVTKNVVAPECVVLMELKSFGVQSNVEALPIDQWENMVVADGRLMNSDGWVRLRLLNVNNGDGTGVSMSLQVNRNNSARVSA